MDAPWSAAPHRGEDIYLIFIATPFPATGSTGTVIRFFLVICIYYTKIFMRNKQLLLRVRHGIYHCFRGIT